MPVVRRIVGDARQDHYTFASIVRGIVRSTPFQMRIRPLSEKSSAQTASVAAATPAQ
jgi:hypothetical protein